MTMTNMTSLFHCTLSSFSIVVVCVVDECGDERSFENSGAQEQPTLDQLLPLDVRVVILTYGISNTVLVAFWCT